MELWLVRHGESEGNVDGSHSDSVLTPRGIAQAEALAARLRGQQFSGVLTSPLRRAQQTAELACPRQAAHVEPDLRELVLPAKSFIDVAALGAAGLAKLLELARSPEAHAQDSEAESGREFVGRISGWLQALVASSSQGARVIAFTHFGVVRECVRQTRAPETRGALPQKIGYCEVFQLELHGAASQSDFD